MSSLWFTILTQYAIRFSSSAPCTTPKDDTIEWINKMIVDGPDSWDSAFHKVKLERIMRASQIGPLRL